MRRYQAAIEIKAAPDEVFAYVADLRRHNEWAAQPIVIESGSADIAAIGARASSRAHQFGRHNQNELVVMENDPPRRFAFEASGREGRFLHSFDLEPTAAGTRLTKTLLVINANPVIALLMPLFAIITPRALAGDVGRIKAKLEA
jgi:hypothetical protein